jgi:LacI family transcriptional regulator
VKSSPPSQARTTLRDVASAASVTPAVVSRVLSDDKKLRVRPETRERVLAVVRELRYTPNNSARALRTATSGAICLVVTDVGNPIHASTLRGAQRSAETSRRVVMLADADEFQRHPDRLRELVDSRRVDALILHLAGIKGDSAMRRVAEPHLPTVIVNSRVRGLASSVSLDDAAASSTATDHLLDLGHTEVAFITGLPGSDRSTRRLHGVVASLEARGLSLPSEWVVDGGFDTPRGFAAGKSLLSGPRRPTAVVVANVMAGVGVLAACHELGVMVPQELSVIALIDAWFCDHTSPPLTVVDMPVVEMGATAFDLAVKMIEGEPRQSIVLRDPPPKLVLRASTAPPRSG